MIALILEFFDGFLEGRVQFTDLAEEQLWETEKYGRVYTPFRKIINDLLYVSCEIGVVGRVND
jgi:hypothetical protein